MWKSIASNFLTVAIVILFVIGGVIGWGQTQYRAEGPLEQAVFFEVPRGASLRSVSNRLAEEGAVSNASVFRVGVEYAGLARQLKFGNYEIPAGASMAEIIDILTAGGPSTFRFVANYVIRNAGAEMRFRERIPGTGEVRVLAEFAAGDPLPEAYAEAVENGTPIVYRVSVAEGLSSWQIVEGLKGADFLEGEVEELPAEGSLAPDTYELKRGSDRGALLSQMAQAQTRILDEAWANRAPDLPLKTKEEALVLASIVEKETGQPEERKQVASVFINRLNQGMKLQTDPTVIYGITKGVGNGLGRGIRQSELRRRSNYNTYIISGLPPTPIANPGRLAIEAALNPDETPFIFFVADGTGGHAFATNIGDHNRNVAVWRRIERERAEQNQ